MEQTINEPEAPALARGLALLMELNKESPSTLETLAGKLNYPKASLLRLLNTLLDLGLIRKLEDKRYEPLWQLVPLGDTQSSYRQRIHKLLLPLCEATACTAEWYEPTSEGMKLLLQETPDVELKVQAQPGFLRAWDGEFDAVARIGYAFAREAPPIQATQRYTSNGQLSSVTVKEARALILDSGNSVAATDTAFNCNGVRRHAVAALEEGTFRGVLALAEKYHFQRSPNPKLLLRQLKETLLGL